MEFLRRLTNFFLRFGLREGIARIVRHAFSFIYFHGQLVFYAKEISGAATARHDQPAGIEVKQLRADDLASLAGALYIDRRVARERIEAGDVCVAVIAGGRIAASCWMLTRFADLPVLDLRPPLPRGVGFLDNIVTDKAYRRRGYGRLIVEEFERIAPALGCTTLIMAVLIGNKPSRSLCVSMGYELFKHARMKRVMGFRRYESQTILPQLDRLLRLPVRSEG